MPNVKERFSDNGDDRRINDIELLSGLGVKREPRSRPTKNHVANLAPLRFRRYFNNNSPRLVACRIYKGNVNVTVRFNFENNDAARQIKPFVFSVGARVPRRKP
jgi:hypothetical protein